MTDDVITDLKQFIAGTLSQQFSLFRVEFGEEIRAEFNVMDKRIDRLDLRMDDLEAKTDAIMAAVGYRFDDHDRRIHRLEQKFAG